MSRDALSKARQIKALLSPKDNSLMLAFDPPVSFYHALSRAKKNGLELEDVVFQQC